MATIHCIGPIKNIIGGFPTHAINFFKALNKLTPITSSDANEPHQKADINIMLNFPEKFDYLKTCSGTKIGYTTFESARPPIKFFEPLKYLDQMWVPCHWNQKILIENGADPNKIKVVPEGVDPDVFNPHRKPQPVLSRIPGYKFLCVGRWDRRKNLSVLAKAFDEEFANDPVYLVMASTVKIPLDGIRHREKFIFVNSIYSHSAFARLYTSCNAFVLPTRTEGCGLPIMEAMACGLPVITTNYSGVTEYANYRNVYEINYTLEDIDYPVGWPAEYYIFGQWATPDPQHLKYLMRYVYEHQSEAKEKGAYASNDILNNWTWDNAAQKAFNYISHTDS